MDRFKEKHPQVFCQFATDEDSRDPNMLRFKAGISVYPPGDIPTFLPGTSPCG